MLHVRDGSAANALQLYPRGTSPSPAWGLGVLGAGFKCPKPRPEHPKPGTLTRGLRAFSKDVLVGVRSPPRAGGVVLVTVRSSYEVLQPSSNLKENSYGSFRK